MIGNRKSNRQQANSLLLLIFFIAPKLVKATRFTLSPEWALSACPFVSLGLYFLFFTTMSASMFFSGLSGVQSLYSTVLQTSPARCHWLEETHLLHTQVHPEQLPSQPKHAKTSKYRQRTVCLHAQSLPHMYRGPDVMIEQHDFCTSLNFLGQSYWLHLWRLINLY